MMLMGVTWSVTDESRCGYDWLCWNWILAQQKQALDFAWPRSMRPDAKEAAKMDRKVRWMDTTTTERLTLRRC